MPERRTHDYVRSGTTTLFAALDVASAQVTGSLHRRHRAIEFCKFLAKIDDEAPTEVEVHLICDNLSTHKTPAVMRWLKTHPRFQLHFTPTSSSWLNQVQHWLGLLTDKQLRRGTHKSPHAPEKDIRTWVATRNQNPRPFACTKTTDEILEHPNQHLQPTPSTRH
jgi:transposase